MHPLHVAAADQHLTSGQVLGTAHTVGQGAADGSAIALMLINLPPLHGRLGSLVLLVGVLRATMSICLAHVVS